MTTATQKLLTAEEFGRLPDPPDGSKQELVKGVIVTTPPPKGRHGSCCAIVGSRVLVFVDTNRLGHGFTNNTGFVLGRDPDTVRGPDVSYWSRERLPDIPEEYIAIPPDLAIEVVSPSDHFNRVQGKVVGYLACSVALLWVIDPIVRSVFVYRPGQPLRILAETDTLDGEEVLSGFRLAVRELFV